MVTLEKVLQRLPGLVRVTQHPEARAAPREHQVKWRLELARGRGLPGPMEPKSWAA